MFRSIELANFQSHKHSIIEFCEGLNVISGSSDSGKSAILRALRWVYDNRPQGDAIRNWNSKKEDLINVRVNFNEGAFVSKEKDTKARYRVFGTRKPLEAFKQDVPDEIREAFNLSDYNIQSQHDPYFLLNDSPGEVAKKLNKVIGLDVIDKLFRFLNSHITDTKKALEREEANGNTLSARIGNLAYLDDVEKDINALEILDKKKETLRCDLYTVTIALDNIERHNEEIEKMQQVVKLEQDVIKLLSTIDKYEDTKEGITGLSELVASIKSVEERLTLEKEWLSVENSHNELIAMLPRLSVKVNSEAVSNLLGSIQDYDSKEQALSKSIVNQVATYEKLLKEHKMCPLCGSAIDKKTLDKLLSV